MWPLLSTILGQKRRKCRKCFSEPRYLINSLKSISQKGSFRVAKLWFPIMMLFFYTHLHCNTLVILLLPMSLHTLIIAAVEEEKFNCANLKIELVLSNDS